MVSISQGQSQRSVRALDFIAEANGVLEFKKVPVMASGQLQQFHGAVIEVELEIQGSFRSISGKGSYEASYPDLGPVLKILVGDPSGDFEILLAESDWSGHFEKSKLPGCHYRLSL